MRQEHTRHTVRRGSEVQHDHGCLAVRREPWQVEGRDAAGAGILGPEGAGEFSPGFLRNSVEIFEDDASTLEAESLEVARPARIASPEVPRKSLGDITARFEAFEEIEVSPLAVGQTPGP